MRFRLVEEPAGKILELFDVPGVRSLEQLPGSRVVIVRTAADAHPDQLEALAHGLAEVLDPAVDATAVIFVPPGSDLGICRIKPDWTEADVEPVARRLQQAAAGTRRRLHQPDHPFEPSMAAAVWRPSDSARTLTPSTTTVAVCLRCGQSFLAHQGWEICVAWEALPSPVRVGFLIYARTLLGLPDDMSPPSHAHTHAS